MAAAALLQRLTPPLDGGVEDLLLPLYQGLALIVLRVLSEKLLFGPLTRHLKRADAAQGGKAAKPPARRAYEVIDNAFLVAVIAPLSAWGWWVMLRHNGPCTPAAPGGCLEGWPGHPMSYQFRVWWLSVGGLYVGEMVGTALGGVGFKLSGEMIVHHIVTMVLMLYGYFGGLHRYGQMATTVLDTSNTFLHLAKAVHAAGLPRLEPTCDALFKLFAAVFFAVRVVMPPPCMLYPGIVHGRVLPAATYYTTNGLMLVVYGLQLMWFWKIVRIATGAADKEQEAGGGAKGAAKAAAAAAPALAGASGKDD